jgi:hypothetical protein
MAGMRNRMPRLQPMPTLALDAGAQYALLLGSCC